MYGTRLYRIYQGMKQRCNNPKAPHYKDYGGRGIKICKEWNTPDGFPAFHEWAMNNGYSDDLTIDRIDVNGNYEPNNCRWVTNLVQARNKRNSKHYDFMGQKMNLAQIGKATGIGRSTLRERVKRTGCIDVSSTDRIKQINYKGKMISLQELSKIIGISYSTLEERRRRGYTDEEICLPLHAKSCKEVIQFDINGKEITRFKNAYEAKEQLGISHNSICQVCHKKRKTAGGYIWRYANEV